MFDGFLFVGVSCTTFFSNYYQNILLLKLKSEIIRFTIVHSMKNNLNVMGKPLKKILNLTIVLVVLIVIFISTGALI